MLAHLVTIATCLLTRATAVPAFAGGLSNPVVPASASTFNLGPEPRNDTAFEPSDNDCPATDGTIPLYLPDPDSCTKYTVCSGAFGQKMECPPGMHFSASTSSCTFPALANCPLLENMTETISFTNLKGPPGINPTAYPNVGLTGLPAFGNPAEGIGQLPDKTPKDSLSSSSNESDKTSSDKNSRSGGNVKVTESMPELSTKKTDFELFSRFTKVIPKRMGFARNR